MPRDLDMIKHAKGFEKVKAAKARYWSQQAQDPQLRHILQEIAQAGESHMGRLDAVERQLGRRVMDSPYQRVTDTVKF